jgi:hypothetical protein
MFGGLILWVKIMKSFPQKYLIMLIREAYIILMGISKVKSQKLKVRSLVVGCGNHFQYLVAII